MRNVEELDLDILDLRLVSIGALRRPNVIVLSSLTLETSKGSALGLVVNMKYESVDKIREKNIACPSLI